MLREPQHTKPQAEGKLGLEFSRASGFESLRFREPQPTGASGCEDIKNE